MCAKYKVKYYNHIAHSGQVTYPDHCTIGCQTIVAVISLSIHIGKFDRTRRAMCEGCIY